jgi:hypothetical protein
MTCWRKRPLKRERLGPVPLLRLVDTQRRDSSENLTGQILFARIAAGRSGLTIGLTNLHHSTRPMTL